MLATARRVSVWRTGRLVRATWQRLVAELLATLRTARATAVARDVPFDAIQFSLYEAMKRAALARRRADAGAAADSTLVDLVLWENAVLGSVAGAVAAAATCPLDVIKTRMMTQTATAAGLQYTGERRRGEQEAAWEASFSTRGGSLTVTHTLRVPSHALGCHAVAPRTLTPRPAQAGPTRAGASWRTRAGARCSAACVRACCGSRLAARLSSAPLRSCAGGCGRRWGLWRRWHRRSQRRALQSKLVELWGCFVVVLCCENGMALPQL